MKKICYLLSAFALSTSFNIDVAIASNVTPRPLNVKYNASVEREMELLFEDFSNVPSGKTETIEGIGERYVDLIASSYYEPGRYIDDSFTPETGTWEGEWVYAGEGGKVILQPYTSQQGAVLRTPLGDYSGDINVKVRCRYATAFYGSSETSTGYTSTWGSQIQVRPGKGGYDLLENATSDIGGYGLLESPIFYDTEGWQEFTFTFRNESSNKDGFIEFRTIFAVEIDWIKITDAGTYLASPTVHEPTDFTEDGFTIHWDRMRSSFDYYIDLWKVEYKGDNSALTLNFDNDAEIANWTLYSGSLSEDGIDGTRAWILDSSEMSEGIESPHTDTRINYLSYDVMFKMEDEDAINGYGLYGMLLVDGLTENGWEPVEGADMYFDGYITKADKLYSITVEGNEIADRYRAVMISSYGFYGGNHALIDNIRIESPRDFDLVRVVGSENGAIRDEVNDDYEYNRYFFTAYTDYHYKDYYTFKGLEPGAEYYYRVRSHNVNVFAGTEKHHAFGVPAPQLESISNVSENGFVVKWKEVTKGDYYVVDCYSLEEIDADESDYIIFSEWFSNCVGSDSVNSMEFIGNETETRLDAYTDMPGWTGMNNYTGLGLIGGDLYTDTRLTSPPLPLNPERGPYLIYIEAYGYKGDALYLYFEKMQEALMITFSGDYISGYIEVDTPFEGERISFNSYNYLPYAIDCIRVMQDVKEGDVIKTFVDSKETGRGITTTEFSGLDKDINYEVTVKACHELDRKKVYSTGNESRIITLLGNRGEASIEENVAPASEVARFNINGVEVDSNYHGLVIIRMSDGSSRKIMVK